MIMRLSCVRELYIQRAAQNLIAPAGRKVADDYQGAGEGAMLATPRITRFLRRSSAPQRHHSLRVTCALRLVFMHEIDIHMGWRLRAELIDPCLVIDIGLAAAPQAEIAVARGSDIRRAALICIGNAKRGALAMQGLVVSSLCQESWRNSKTMRGPAGICARKSLKRGRSFFNVGGNWNRTAPSLSSSVVARRRNSIASGTALSRRFSCVMRRGAFSAKKKCLGTAFAQRANTSSAGMR